MNTFKFALLALAIAVFSGSFAYSQPPFGRGGDRGGGDRGGFRGPPGGDRGGDRGGSRGGFDPSGFMDRLDRNGNGVLDPDEQQGPAQFLIKRLESMDPSISAGKPIPLQKVKDGFAKMRGESGGGDDRGRGGDDRGRDSWRGRSNDSDADKALQAELLVPGFGEDLMREMLMGFGATAELLSAEVSDADRAEAKSRMSSFDRNRDGFLTKDELSPRFSGNPMDFDRNRDGRLSVDELAVRYARRREGREEGERSRNQQTSKRRDERRNTEAPDLFNGRQSYRSESGRSAPEGLPGFFTERDQNRDGQVSMGEFTDEWNDDELKRFFESDFNQDGVITAAEALRGVEEGPAQHGSGSSMAKAPAPATESAGGPIDAKYLSVAKRIISRRDKNKDGALTVSEWQTMLMSPAAADANKDGRITAEEYARWTLSRERKR